MFLVPALAALNDRWNRPLATTGMRSLRLNANWMLAVIGFALVIGYRYQVGGDWGSYLAYVERTVGLDLQEAITLGEPGYMLINWISARAGWGVYGVNLICGLIFMLGLAVFCRTLPRPWLALAVAVPYLLIVVAMGYSRQGVAIGFVMLGLAALGRREWVWFVFTVILAATFHRSALIMLPIAALASTQNRVWIGVWVLIASALAYQAMLEESLDGYIKNYIEAEYQSQGALIRGMMNLLPAAILLIWRRRFLLSTEEMTLWRLFALISVMLGVLIILATATTAVDRIGLYMLPLQLLVFSYLPDVFGRQGRRNGGWVFAVLGYYGAVLFVWLNFAVHSDAWVPYRFYLLE